MSTHDIVTRRVFGVTHETIVRRIVKTFGRADAATLEAGARWYDAAGIIATDIARTIDGDTLAGAALIAALSPRTDWARNVAGAVAMANGGKAAGCMGDNVTRAERVLAASSAGTDVLAALGNGPKVRAFALNIAGDREAVTVDVWACRVAGVDENKLSRVGAYDAIAHAYRLAARRLGVDPATCQAVTWVVARNGRAA